MASQPSHPPQLLSPPQQATASLAPDVAMILDHQFHKDDDIAIDANGQPKTLEETLAELRSKLKMTKRTTPRSTPVPGGSDVPMNGVEVSYTPSQAWLDSGLLAMHSLLSRTAALSQLQAASEYCRKSMSSPYTLTIQLMTVAAPPRTTHRQTTPSLSLWRNELRYRSMKREETTRMATSTLPQAE